MDLLFDAQIYSKEKINIVDDLFSLKMHTKTNVECLLNECFVSQNNSEIDFARADKSRNFFCNADC